MSEVNQFIKEEIEVNKNPVSYMDVMSKFSFDLSEAQNALKKYKGKVSNFSIECKENNGNYEYKKGKGEWYAIGNGDLTNSLALSMKNYFSTMHNVVIQPADKIVTKEHIIDEPSQSAQPTQSTQVIDKSLKRSSLFSSREMEEKKPKEVKEDKPKEEKKLEKPKEVPKKEFFTVKKDNKKKVESKPTKMKQSSILSFFGKSKAKTEEVKKEENVKESVHEDVKQEVKKTRKLVQVSSSSSSDESEDMVDQF